MLTHIFTRTVGQAPNMVTTYDTIHLIGAGGNGAPMLMRLHKMHTTLKALGLSSFKVVLWDMDEVSASNIGRQPFYPADIGKNKAKLLIERLQAIDPSIHDWEARPEAFTENTQLRSALMVITCVDNKAARRAVHHAVFNRGGALYWLDMGNEANTGQIVLGECRGHNRKLRLPVVTEFYPVILDDTIPEDDTPSCSTEEAIAKQDLFINESVVAHAASLIWQAFHKGFVTHPVIYVNVEAHSVMSVPISRDFYKRKGIKTGRANNPLIADI